MKVCISISRLTDEPTTKDSILAIEATYPGVRGAVVLEAYEHPEVEFEGSPEDLMVMLKGEGYEEGCYTVVEE